MKVCVTAPAKLNLTLDVLGKDGGYHLLSSLCVAVDLCDKITIAPRADGKIKVVCPSLSIPEEKNNAYLAAAEFQKAYPEFGGATVEIEKKIPVGGGMGGSSADVVGVLLGLSRLTGGVPVKEMADRLTSDGAFLLQGGCGVMEGRGERVRPLPFREVFAVVLPGEVPISAGECFRRCDAHPMQAPITPQAETLWTAGDLSSVAARMKNDLLPAAMELSPELEERLSLLRSTRPLGASMTGSGSAVFALYATEREAEAAARSVGGIAVRSVPHGGRVEKID